MAAHSSILAWRIPCTEEPGGLQSKELETVRVSNTLLFTFGGQKSQMAGTFLVYRCDRRHFHFTIQIYKIELSVQFSCSVVSSSLQPRGLWPARLLCPRDSVGENTGVGGHSLLQGVFLTQGSNPRQDMIYLFPFIHSLEYSFPEA